MDISFATKKLEKLCESERTATKELGRDSARKLAARLADMDAVDVVTELVAGHPHPLAGDRDGQLAVRLAGGHRLVISPAHDPVPLKDDGSVNWAEVSSVRVEFVGDYHE